MQKIYLRVQHDVRTGPFTLEELLQFNFTTEDLIWVIGQSEDWLPIMEISTLQPYFIQSSDGSLTVKDGALASIRSEQAVFTNQHANPNLDTQQKRVHEELVSEEAKKQQEIENKRQARLDSFFKSQSKETFTESKEKKQDHSKVDQEDDEETFTFFKNKRNLIGAGALILVFLVGNSYLTSTNKSRPKPVYSTETPLLATPAPANNSTAYQLVEPSPENESVSSEPIPASSVKHTEQSSAVESPSTSLDAYIDSIRTVSENREPGLTKADYAYTKPSPYLQQILKRRAEAKKHEKITTMKDLREAAAKRSLANKNTALEARVNSRNN